MGGIRRLRGDPRRGDIIRIDLMVRNLQRSIMEFKEEFRDYRDGAERGSTEFGVRLQHLLTELTREFRSHKELVERRLRDLMVRPRQKEATEVGSPKKSEMSMCEL